MARRSFDGQGEEEWCRGKINEEVLNITVDLDTPHEQMIDEDHRMLSWINGHKAENAAHDDVEDCNLK